MFVAYRILRYCQLLHLLPCCYSVSYTWHLHNHSTMEFSFFTIRYATFCLRENPGCLFIATNRDATGHLNASQEVPGTFLQTDLWFLQVAVSINLMECSFALVESLTLLILLIQVPVAWSVQCVHHLRKNPLWSGNHQHLWWTFYWKSKIKLSCAVILFCIFLSFQSLALKALVASSS